MSLLGLAAAAEPIDPAWAASRRDVLEIIARASTPHERRAGGWLRPVDGPTAAERFLRWSTSVAGGRPERAAEIMAARGLTIDDWLAGLTDVSVVDGQPLPAWVRNVLLLIDHVADPTPADAPRLRDPRLRDVAGAGLPPWVDGDQPWRFHPGFSGWLALARQGVSDWASGLPIEPDVCDELALELARRQLTAVGPLLMELAARLPADPLFGSDPAADWLRIWADHPVAARLLATCWRQWRETTHELLTRIRADLPALCPGRRVVRIDQTAGDQHNDGRGVARLHLDDGTSMFLKPRSDGLHGLLSAVLAAVDATGPAVGLRLPVAVERDGYGWTYEVERGDCPEETGVDAYFRRAGTLLRVLQALGATDLHHENFIPAADLPVLVDLETAVAPGPLATLDPPDAVAERAGDLPGPTSMVTSAVAGAPGMATVDIGGLAGPDETLTPYGVPTLTAETAGPTLGKARVVLANGGALPTCDGRPVGVAGHESALLAGYADGQRRLARWAAEDLIGAALRAGPEPTVRLVIRPTRTYVQLRVRSIAPAALVDGIEREFVLERLFLATGSAPDGLIQAEVEALRELDVPMFTVPFTRPDLVSDRGVVMPGALRESPADRTRRRLSAVAERSDQLDDLRATLFSMAPREAGQGSPENPDPETPNPDIPAAPQTADAAVDELVSIVLDRAIELADGTLGWIGLEHDPNRSRWTYDRLGPGLTGQAGVGLALAVLAAARAHRTEVARDWAAAARAALLGSVARTRSGRHGAADAFSGPAGTLYAAAVGARLLDGTGLLGDTGLLEAARSLIEPCLRAARRNEPSVVISGIDGAILALLRLPASPRVADALTELAALPRTYGEVDPPDPWARSLPSRRFGTRWARQQLAAVGIGRSDAVEPTETGAPTGPGDRLIASLLGELSATTAEPHQPQASLRDALDQLVGAGPARRGVLTDALLRRRASTGRWGDGMLAPDATLLSGIHGLAALAAELVARPAAGPDLPIARALR